jgi:hypothetical protein
MTIEYIRVRSNITGSHNTLNLIVRGSLPFSNVCKIVIERPGQNLPYLAEKGWQSNYHKCLIDVVRSGEMDFDLCLPLGLVQYLDSEHNYKVGLFDLNDVHVGSFGMNWSPPPRPRVVRVEPVVLAPVKFEKDPNEPEPNPEPIIQEPAGDPYIPSPLPVPKREILNCVYCGGQIFSTLFICPYCGKPVKPS